VDIQFWPFSLSANAHTHESDIDYALAYDIRHQSWDTRVFITSTRASNRLRLIR